jgi:anti-anti-sigma regulatory factor
MDNASPNRTEGRLPILRVTIRHSQEAVTLILEGRFTGPWIGEVERAWSAVAGKTEGRHVVVDLSDVTFIDEEAKRLLKRIVEQEGELRANDVMTKAIIEEVQRKPAEAQ